MINDTKINDTKIVLKSAKYRSIFRTISSVQA